MRGCVIKPGREVGRGHSQGLRALHSQGLSWALMGLFRQALLPLALEGTDIGQTKAAQALAKLTITSNPEMTFPGERVRYFLPQLTSLSPQWALIASGLGSSLRPTKWWLC